MGIAEQAGILGNENGILLAGSGGDDLVGGVIVREIRQNCGLMGNAWGEGDKSKFRYVQCLFDPGQRIAPDGQPILLQKLAELPRGDGGQQEFFILPVV